MEDARKKGCGYEQERIWTKYLSPFNSLLVIINSSLNFFIYVFFDIDFQRVLRQKLSSWKFLSYTLGNNRLTQNNTTRTSANDIELQNMSGDHL
jgi:hypothetical protein